MRLHNQYEVLEKIAEGGFGAVWKAKDIHMDQSVAIKELHLEDPSALRDEARVLAELRHENIVGFRQLFPEQDRWFMVMDYVEGGSLAQWIVNGTLYEGGVEKAAQRMLSIATHFGEGLDYAHQKGVIHQDVKPGNLLIAANEVAKVTDFGLARARPMANAASSIDSKQSVLVSSGGLTPAYCSPEQARREKLTSKTDTWSWGLSILEMFAGGVFWQHGTTAPEALQTYLKMGTADPSIPRMPVGIVNLLKRCFTSSPSERLSLREALEMLRAVNPKSIVLPKLEFVTIAKSEQENLAVIKALEANQRFAIPGNQTLIDTETNLMWSAAPHKASSLQEALEHVRHCGDGGYSDWRLPEIDELKMLWTDEATRGLLDSMLSLSWLQDNGFPRPMTRIWRQLWTAQSRKPAPVKGMGKGFFPFRSSAAPVFLFDFGSGFSVEAHTYASYEWFVLPVRAMK